MLHAGVTPDIFELERVDATTCSEAEKFWISYFRMIGSRLVNCAEGGEGTILANRTSFKKGFTPWNAGRPWSRETRVKIGDVQRGKPKGPQSISHRTALSETAKKRNPECYRVMWETRRSRGVNI